MEHFWDGENGGFYLTADDAENILMRKKDIYDGAILSGNSVAMLNLARLGKITGNPEFEKKATLVGKAFSKSVRRSPAAHTMLMTALDFAIDPTAEVVIAGDLQSPDTGIILSKLRKAFVPGKIVIFRPDGEPEIINIAEYTRNLKSKDGKATAYVCRNFSCKLPTTDVGEMMKLLNI